MQTYPTGYAESHRIAEQIFREILPRHGMAVREEQIALCHEVLDTLYNKEISLCEAGVGIGKTLAYLVACILWQMHRPSQLKMPVVISTSSVALQDAILNEYLPDLSAVLGAAPRETKPAIDPSLLLKLQSAMQSLSQPSPGVELLRALRPLLSEKRAKKVDDAVRIMQLVQLLPTLKESGLFRLGGDSQ